MPWAAQRANLAGRGTSVLDVPALSWFIAVRDRDLAAAIARFRTRLTAAGFADAGPPPCVRGADGPDAGGSTALTDAVIVWADQRLDDATVRRLLGLRRPLVLAGPTLDAAGPGGVLAEAAGLRPGGRTAAHDIRVRPGAAAGWLADQLPDHPHAGRAHLGAHAHVTDGVLRLAPSAVDVQTLLTAHVGLTEHPVATWRPAGQVLTWTLGSRPAALASPSLPRLLALTLRRAMAPAAPAPVRVGLLGYGAIGHEHSRAVAHVPGLELAAVCDASEQRRAAARARAPEIRTYPDAGSLLADPAIDLVVVSTPPDAHATWARAALATGRHVLVEKPFAIRTDQADAVLELAAQRGLLALVYQNRRFDPDHIALRRVVDDGLLGDVFHAEAFVGGYGHPCNLWHSDAAVSGGAFYDWGAHVLDQLLDLVPGDVDHVTAITQKRVWLDVTNADHARVTVRLAGGAEVTFVYSDLAAALKPRWYVLGTRAAVVGHWRSERVVARSDIGTLAEDVLAPADSPPLLDLHAADGSVTRLATPPVRPYAFHAELADHLRLGLPMTVTAQQSRRVLAVMEAAVESAESGGYPVAPC